ncbi:hypothetical protein ABZ403_02960 [Micromonospora zamorensis]
MDASLRVLDEMRLDLPFQLLDLSVEDSAHRAQRGNSRGVSRSNRC